MDGTGTRKNENKHNSTSQIVVNCASIVLVVAKKMQMGLDAFHFKQSRGGHLGDADRPKLPNSGGTSGGVAKAWWSIRQAMVESSWVLGRIFWPTQNPS